MDLEFPGGRRDQVEKSWKFQGVGGQTGKNPPWGGYGYFLEPHISKCIVVAYCLQKKNNHSAF